MFDRNVEVLGRQTKSESFQPLAHEIIKRVEVNFSVKITFHKKLFPVSQSNRCFGIYFQVKTNLLNFIRFDTMQNQTELLSYANYAQTAAIQHVSNLSFNL